MTREHILSEHFNDATALGCHALLVQRASDGSARCSASNIHLCSHSLFDLNRLSFCILLHFANVVLLFSHLAVLRHDDNCRPLRLDNSGICTFPGFQRGGRVCAVRGIQPQVPSCPRLVPASPFIQPRQPRGGWSNKWNVLIGCTRGVADRK